MMPFGRQGVLPYAFTAELSGYVNTKRLTGANEVYRETSQVDIGLQRSFLKNKAIVRLAVNDIYKGTKAWPVQRFDGFSMESYSYWETRQIRINFTYKFSDNSNVKGPRSRTSANMGDPLPIANCQLPIDSVCRKKATI